MNNDYEAQEFAKLTEQLGDLANLGKPFEPTMAHLSDFCDILGGLSCHVNRYITKKLSSQLPDPPPIPNDLAIAFVACYELLCGLMDHMCLLTCGSPEDGEETEEEADETDGS